MEDNRVIFPQELVEQISMSDPLPAVTSKNLLRETNLDESSDEYLSVAPLAENSTFAAPIDLLWDNKADSQPLPFDKGHYQSLCLKPPLSPVPEDPPMRTQTLISVNSSSSSLGQANFSQSFVFQDLHEIEQKLESNYIYTAIDHAFECRALTYGQTTELRNKVSLLVEIYAQRFRLQKNLQDTVINQIRYYQERFEELYEAETLPSRMRQQLQGLQGDTHRLNDELAKSKIQMVQLESEILKLESEKSHLHETLEAILTADEFQNISTSINLEKQVIAHQLDNYNSLTGKTLEYIRDNSGVVVRMEQCVENFRSEMTETRKDLADLTNLIPHIRKDYSLHSAQLAKLDDELHLLAAANQGSDQHDQSINEINLELNRKCQNVFNSRVTCGHELEDNMQNLKELVRKMEKALDADVNVKNEKAALEQEIENAQNCLRLESANRFQCLSEKDRLSSHKQILHVQIQQIAQANENDGEGLSRLKRRVTEKEIEAEHYRQQILKLQHHTTSYTTEIQAKKDGNTALYRQKREGHKALFMSFMHIRKIVKEGRRQKEQIERMEIAQRSVNISCEKLKKSIIILREGAEQKELIAKFAAGVLAEKLEKVEAMQREYYRLERERQDNQEAYRICQGGLHEHKDRLMYVKDESKKLKDNYMAVNRSLEKTQQERRIMWMSLQRVRNEHHAERGKLKELETKFERDCSRVLVLRRDLDINLLKCETFTETFDLASELRACEAALLIDSTTQYMLKNVEKNQIESATNQTELRHRSLNSYVEWLHKTADTDIKLLHKRLRWQGALQLKYTSTRDELKSQLVETVNKSAHLNQLIKEGQETPINAEVPVVSTEELQQKEEMLSKMLITMEQRFFQQSVRQSLMDGICREATRQIQTQRDALTADHQKVTVQRNKVLRVKRRHKLAMIDFAAIKTQLCNELVLSDSLQNVQQLTFEKYNLPQLQAGDHNGQTLQITDGSDQI